MKTMVVLDERLIEALIDAAKRVRVWCVLTKEPVPPELEEAYEALGTALAILEKAKKETMT